MILNYKHYILSFICIILLIFCFIYIYSGLKIKNSNLIEFNNQNLSPNFEINISQNIENINNYLKNYNFIESYIIKKKNNRINIEITLKKPFAKNIFNKEVVFNDSSKAPFSLLNKSFIGSISLIDVSQDTMKINNYLKFGFEDLRKIFSINQIEFIDERRYDLILDNNIKIMLPKKIDKKFILFINEKFNLLKNSADFKEYLDFRNFDNKTIRVK